MSSADKTKLVKFCSQIGYTVRMRTHPKTKARWKAWEMAG